MNLTTFLRILFAQAVLAGVNWALTNLTNLQIPFPVYTLPIIAAGLNAIAAYIREHFGVQRAGLSGFFAKIF